MTESALACARDGISYGGGYTCGDSGDNSGGKSDQNISYSGGYSMLQLVSYSGGTSEQKA